MAGIGFELRKMVNEDTFIGDMKAYAYAGMISSGPWIITMLCISVLWVFSYPALGIGTLKFIRVTIVYTYAYSLITTGMIQLVVTRFLADRLYLKQRNIFLPTYVGLMVTTVIFQGIVGVFFYSFSEAGFYFKLIGIMLYIAVSCIWQSMIFLSAARDFLAIVASFVLGCFASFILAISLGNQFGINGYLLGYTLGQIAIVFLLMQRIFYEFDSIVVCRFDFLRQIGNYYQLFIFGVLYFVALWIDKIIYWYSPGGEHVDALFYSHYPYDSCVFLAYLTIIPGLAHFLLDVETNFYESYKGFYGAIINKGTFKEIQVKKKEMTQVIVESLSRLVVLQTVVTALFLFYAPLFANYLKLESDSIPVLMAAGVGAYFHVFLVVAMLIILYFDQRRIAINLALIFLITNSSFTVFVIKYAPHYMGWGYAAATIVTFCYAAYSMIYILRNVEYLTFVRQPLVKPSLPAEAVEALEESKTDLRKSKT